MSKFDMSKLMQQAQQMQTQMQQMQEEAANEIVEASAGGGMVTVKATGGGEIVAITIDPKAIEDAIGPRTRAVIPVHMWGAACDMDAIMAIADAAGAVVIEDAAQALLSTCSDRPLGSIGSMGTLSFHQTKNVSSGEAGALLVNDERLIRRAEILQLHGAWKDAIVEARRACARFATRDARRTNARALIAIAFRGLRTSWATVEASSPMAARRGGSTICHISPWTWCRNVSRGPRAHSGVRNGIPFQISTSPSRRPWRCRWLSPRRCFPGDSRCCGFLAPGSGSGSIAPHRVPVSRTW